MLQSGGESDLALEPFDVYIAGELRRQDLEHHLPVEAQIAGDEDATHASAQLPLEGIAGGQGALELVE